MQTLLSTFASEETKYSEAEWVEIWGRLLRMPDVIHA